MCFCIEAEDAFNDMVRESRMTIDSPCIKVGLIGQEPLCFKTLIAIFILVREFLLIA